MPSLTLIRGLPGSGKSTMAKTMLGHIHFENDMWMYNGDKYEFTEKGRKEAIRKCLSHTREALMDGNDVVVSNCFLTKASMNAYFKIAKEAGAIVEVCVAKGNYPNIHNVPDDVLASMKERWEP